MRNFRTRIFMGLGTARAHHPLSHKSKTIGAMLLGSAAVLGLWVTPGLADGVNCQHVGGGVLTNFIDASDTDGIAIGDLRGSVGVAVLGINGSVYHVHHHWVTETGDNILLDEAFLTTIQTFPGQVGLNYLKGVNITGGTGRFAGATGNLAAWGAADLNEGKLTLRYEGTICFKPDAAH
jgi:hypothetical protein